MEKEENFCNFFKFGIYIENETINERVFVADDYNQMTKYQIDLRRLFGSIQKRVQNTLSNTKHNYNINGYKVLDYYIKNDIGYGKLEMPEERDLTINDVIYKGVEVKMGFYINDKPIVERSVYVSKYNPKARFSKELHDLVFDIINNIKHKIKKDDLKLEWENYDIINNYNLHISQVRELSKEERGKLLSRVYKK